MADSLKQCSSLLQEMARLMAEESFRPWTGELKTGVDLGTRNIVLTVLDRENHPVAGISQSAAVVRDGIVVDYAGAVRIVGQLKERLERRLGTTLVKGACAIPPGVAPGSVKALQNVLEAAEFEVTNTVDEPTAAADLLGISSGAVVDVGGGTTGVSILREGKVVYTHDEPTGGTHMTLVLGGHLRCGTEEAERIKLDPAREQEVFPIVQPVVEKMAAIVHRCLQGYEVDTIYVVGGACSFRAFTAIFEKITGIPTVKPEHPLLVTPMGIAMNCI